MDQQKNNGIPARDFKRVARFLKEWDIAAYIDNEFKAYPKNGKRGYFRAFQIVNERGYRFRFHRYDAKENEDHILDLFGKPIVILGASAEEQELDFAYKIFRIVEEEGLDSVIARFARPEAGD